MELFAINRHNDPINTIKSEENEKQILENLLTKIKKRKREQEKEQKLKSEQNQEKVLEESSKRHKDEFQNGSPHNEQNDNEKATSPSGDEEDNDDLITNRENSVDDTTDGYKILGEDIEFEKKEKVDIILPSWLAYPTIIPTNIQSNDDGENLPDYLAAHIRQSLKDLNINRLFPVQNCVIPWILEAHAKPSPFRPRDICVSAPTGSGKTLAFAIPVVQILANRVERKIRALIVLPVAELAKQVFKIFKKLCERTDLKVCLLSKQIPFQLEQEKLVENYKGRYYSKVDIIVSTPGRLVDHLHGTTGFCLKSLKFLVIDEADRIMDAIFQNWLYHLDTHVKNTADMLLSGHVGPLCLKELEASAMQPHKLLFSATLSQDPEKLQNLRLFQPKLFTSVPTSMEELREKLLAASNVNDAEAAAAAVPRGEFVGKYTTPAELSEKYCITESRLKPLTLFSLAKENGWSKFLCFTNSIESSGRLAYVLDILFKNVLVIRELSASLNAKQRANILGQFAQGKVNGLVCSDALARGIDIPNVDIVVSYDRPRHIKTYIHRIGRTARAGRSGTAITLLTQKELQIFNQTLSEVGKVITEEITVTAATEEEHANNYVEALRMLRNKLEKDKRIKLLRKERAQQKSLSHKDPSEMTFMEKLQAQANEATLEQEEKQTTLSSKKKPSKKFRTKKEVTKN